MVVVLSIVMIALGWTFLALQPALRDARVNGAYDNALMLLRTARQRAIEERKRYIVVFGQPAPLGAPVPLGAPKPTSIQVFRWDTGIPVSPAPTQVSTIDLPFDVQFQTLAGLPTGAVPDGFGSGTVAIDFNQGVGAGRTNFVMFLPDGSAHDTLGNLNNGVLYLARNGDLYSSKAITVFGSTGRIRGWRLVNQAGVATWIEQ
jgi:type II secretory pathway pseudopilin PulG